MAKAVAAAHAAANLLDKASRPSEKSYFSDGLFLSKHLQVNQWKDEGEEFKPNRVCATFTSLQTTTICTRRHTRKKKNVLVYRWFFSPSSFPCFPFGSMPAHSAWKRMARRNPNMKKCWAWVRNWKIKRQPQKSAKRRAFTLTIKPYRLDNLAKLG